MQVDSFTPALSAFGLPIYVAPLPAGSIQRVCHDTLPWLISFSLGLMNTTLVYRGLIAIRGCWIFAEWLLGWGVYSHVSLFRSTHPYAALTADAIAVAFWLAVLAGMWFFQRWARLPFLLLDCS
jgi:hypothetical protein